jgi:hypothetical protein
MSNFSTESTAPSNSIFTTDLMSSGLRSNSEKITAFELYFLTYLKNQSRCSWKASWLPTWEVSYKVGQNCVFSVRLRIAEFAADNLTLSDWVRYAPKRGYDCQASRNLQLA